MAEPAHRVERCVKRGAADGVIDDIESWPPVRAATYCSGDIAL